MLLGVTLDEILLLALAVVIGGAVSGMLAGLFGVGGGAVIVPILYEVFGLLSVPEEVRMQLCVGTSIAIIVPTTVRSYLAHRAKGFCVALKARIEQSSPAYSTQQTSMNRADRSPTVAKVKP
jgi:phosphotransferase system  glucose/maltose/N-acetylglucosamine-specific IIC component